MAADAAITLRYNNVKSRSDYASIYDVGYNKMLFMVFLLI